VFKPRLESDYGPAMASFAWAFPDTDTIGGTCFVGPFCVPPYIVNYVANPAIPSRASLSGNYTDTTTVYSDGGGLFGPLQTGFIGEGKYANDTFITNISSCYGDPAQTCAQSSIFGKDLFIPGFNHGTDPDILTNMSDEIVDELCKRTQRCAGGPLWADIYWGHQTIRGLGETATEYLQISNVGDRNMSVTVRSNVSWATVNASLVLPPDTRRVRIPITITCPNYRVTYEYTGQPTITITTNVYIQPIGQPDYERLICQ
jgi:hypothetical protein